MRRSARRRCRSAPRGSAACADHNHTHRPSPTACHCHQARPAADGQSARRSTAHRRRSGKTPDMRHVSTSPGFRPRSRPRSHPGGCSMMFPRANSNRLPHAGHSIGGGTARLEGRPAALRLVPSYGHTTKFTHCRICRTAVMRCMPRRKLRTASGV
jgi:hypothetical protein